MDWERWIEQNPEVMLGKPVFRGTRLTVEHVLRELASGSTDAEVLAGYPRLTVEHIRAAQAYAADLIAADETIVA